MALGDITPGLFLFVTYLNFALWLFVAVLLIAKFTKPKFWPALQRHIERVGVLYAAIIATVSTVGSLWLSNIAGFAPCSLCWYQRIFMYPLVVVLGIGYFKKLRVKLIGLTLAVIGGLIAAYHYSLQFNTNFIRPCGEGAVSCTAQYLHYFGFYSIPLMALTGFVGIIVLLAFTRE